MRIDELDEAQGLTPQMVRNWLNAHHWRFRGPRMDGREDFWPPPGHGGSALAFTLRPECISVEDRADLHHALFLISQCHKVSSQQLLREINPRWRPFPSAAARSAHPGLWLALMAPRKTGHDPRLRTRLDVGSFSFGSPCRGLDYPTLFWASDRGEGADSFGATNEGEFQDFGWAQEWRFWPCDPHGNKVRWPTNDKGELL